MAADRQAGLLDRGEQRVVALVVVVGEADLGREHRELQRLAAHLGDALHLLDREVDVVDRDLVRDDETVGVGRAELVHRVVERDRRLRGATFDLVEVAEPAHFAVEDLLRDAVEVHRLEARLRVGVAGLRHVAKTERAGVLFALA